MEVDKIQTQGCKFPRIGNGRGNNSNKIGGNGEEQYPDDEEDGELKRSRGSEIVVGGEIGRLSEWRSSRIVRVSRESGGKDRHSKVWTSKGLRDRRVRLSVPTAFQFYDLQDRLGYDQPSKAVEWLLKAAAKSIDELPSINTSFPDSPTKMISDEKGFYDSAEVELNGDRNYQHQDLHQDHYLSLSKSACSSTSETSKCSGLSLSRSESRIKARERARERRAEREKEKESESPVTMNPNSQNSFTELLTSGPSQQFHGDEEPNLFLKTRQWSSTPMDYFASGLLSSSSSPRHHHSSGFSGQINLANSLQQSMMINSPFSVDGDDDHHQHFSFVTDHLNPVGSASGGSHDHYSLNFTISSGAAGFNRGTLQSNSPSLLPQIQRLSPLDGSNLPFSIGTAVPNAAPMENHHHHHQFSDGIDGRLQLCYGNGRRDLDQNRKGRN